MLGVPNQATSEEIKTAYRGLAKKFHSDLLPTELDEIVRKKADAIFAACNSAYRTLTDDEKRRAYDASLNQSGASTQSPHVSESAQKAASVNKISELREQERQRNIESLVSELRNGAREFFRIIEILEELSKYKHVLRSNDFMRAPQQQSVQEKISSQQLLRLIIDAVIHIDSTEEEFDIHINKIPHLYGGSYSLRERVKKALKTRRKAFRVLSSDQPTIAEIAQALSVLVEFSRNALIKKTLIQKTEVDFIEQSKYLVEIYKVQRSREIDPNLIQSLTKWNGLRAKVTKALGMS